MISRGFLFPRDIFLSERRRNGKNLCALRINSIDSEYPLLYCIQRGGAPLPKEFPKRVFSFIFYALLALIPIVIFFRYLFAASLPFLVAFAAASLLYRPSQRIASFLRLPYKIVAVGLTVLSVSVFMGLFGFLLWKTVSEIGAFAAEALGGEQGLLENIIGVFRYVSDKLSSLPFISGNGASALKESVTQAFSDTVKNLFVSAASRFPSFAAKLVSAVPEIFLFFIVTVLSAVYFCVDYERLCCFAKERLSEERWRLLAKASGIVRHTAFQFVKSYFVLFLFSFSGLLFGFVLLGEDYAFLFALVTATVDSLPIVGMGIVLFPLAIYHFMLKDVAYGIGVCVLYLVLTVSRQILEPRLLGAGMGIHPLVMLAAMYCGLQVFGIGGMLLAPFFAVTVKNFIGIRKEGKA